MTPAADDVLSPRLSPRLTQLLALGWAAVILVVFFVKYNAWVRLVWLSQILSGASPILHTGPFFGSFWLHRALDLGWCFAVLLTAFAVGAVLTARLIREQNLLTALFALAVGLWSMAVLTLAIGAEAIGRVGWVFLFAACWLSPAPRKFLRKPRWPTMDAWTKLMLVLIVVAILINFLSALTPPFEYDELEYHLGAPSEYIKAGHIICLPHNFYSNLPQLTEMLYLLGLQTRSDIAPKMLHWCFGLLSALGLYAVAARLWSQRIAVTAVALFYCLPFVQDLSQTARIDLATTFFAVLAFGGVLLSSDDDSFVSMAGAAAGFAVATKWTAFAIVFLPALVFLSLTKRSARLSVRFCLLAFAGILPWLIKNLILTGNPVYPLLHTLLPNPHWTESQAALFASKHYAAFNGGRWIEIGERLWQYSFADNGASPILLLVAPLALLFYDRRGRLHHIAWLFLGAYAGWFLFTFRPWRFFLPAAPLVAVLGACAILSTGKVIRVFVITVLLLGFSWMTLGLLADSEEDRQPPQVSLVNLTLGQLSEHDFLQRIGKGVFEPIVWMNEHLPANARVLYIGESRIALAHNEVVWATAFDQHLLSKLPSDPDQLSTALRSRSISHIYINISELARLRTNYGYLKDYHDETLIRMLGEHARQIHLHGNQSVWELQ